MSQPSQLFAHYFMIEILGLFWALSQMQLQL